MKSVIPLVQDEYETLKDMVLLVVGNEQAESMTLAEQQTTTREESFPACLVTRNQQSADQDQIVRHLNIKKVNIIQSTEEIAIEGEYTKRQMLLNRGAMQSHYYRSLVWNEATSEATLEAMDPFGKEWQI